ncbi:nudC domain-containing protein 2-like [Cyclospora cayetanensis]|uniref:NudC domain-containing protein 2-like n=1 Tax=Cyclospora cayetanensis TaxID=88456 RepID=A0A6P6RUV8_9EIME|nr:nudC domain-containing protein 2-like [Cyclospora cayetanensis]
MSDGLGEEFRCYEEVAGDIRKKIQEAGRGRIPVCVQGRLLYEWEQDLTDVHLFLLPPPQTKAKSISVKITPTRLSVGLLGKPALFDEDLFSTVDTSASFWMLEDGELHIQLGKMRKGEIWKSAMRGHGVLNPLATEEVQKKLMLERFGEEHPGFDFSNATFSGAAPDPRSFMGGISYK